MTADAASGQPSGPGRIIILTGEGKGKSSSAFGMVLRAVGWGLPVAVIQFIKGGRPTGEEQAAALLPGVTWRAMGRGFSWTGRDPDAHRRAASEAWSLAREIITADQHRLVVLDEILYAIGLGWLEENEIAAWLRREKPAGQHLILTGRGAGDELVALADTVTVMQAVKHAYAEGIQAARGIEF